MTSKERVDAAINFTKPDQLPMWFDELGKSDIEECMIVKVGASGCKENFVYDEWGCGWTKSEVENMGLVSYEPLKSWDKLDSYSLPDPCSQDIIMRIEKGLERKKDKYYLISTFLFIFERFHCLRGFENTMMDFYLEPENAVILADRITDYFVSLIENIGQKFAGKIDGIKFTEDWGSELSLFISPTLWDDFFKPRYKKVFDVCKKYGYDIWLHSCGKNDAIFDSLIDIGLQVINLQQPLVFNIEEIGKNYAGKLCFLSLCDIQKTLPFADQDEMDQQANQLLQHWGTPNGGFILGDYKDSAAIQVSTQKKQMMYDAFEKCDRWKIKEKI